MTERYFVRGLAVAALLCLPGVQPASGMAAEQLVAQADSPLQVPAAPSPAQPPGPAEQPATAAPEVEGEDGDLPVGEELSLGEIPVIETMELTPDSAKRVLDSYISVREKYVNSDFDQFDNLQDFVDQTEDGKAFEADVKAAGFANVNDWSLAITTLSLTYGSIIDDQTPDLLLQIQEVEQDTEMAQDIKDRLVKALKALIPSDNNRKVVEDLMDDPGYGGKLKLLDIEEE